ncbi:AMP-binding protein [Carboxylicivirga linearis]|uniref:AMP-binding protein n=1 Tax=Carboxylicivirga linearis TaxID=1628157 RepID=A0ABS5JX02_9BACT|nr:AMP-binding protein [Carboxylicivirga linearis]MBS2099450.1 AMP-binding protein [Carboxylicivirga linearis]
MKQHHPLIIKFARIFFSWLRAILSLRYTIEVKGEEVLKQDSPKLILPNHQAIMDPIVLFAHLYKYTTAVPVVTSGYYDMPVAKTMFSSWGAVRVSDLEAGSRNTNVLEEIVKSVNHGFELKKNIVIYPSGQIATQGYEKILNKQSAYRVVKELPQDVEVIAARIRGFWGSRWSKAWTGKSPNFFGMLLKTIGFLFVNLLFFMPRRKITIEFVNVSEQTKSNSQLGKNEFNTFLEETYNVHGEEPVNYLKAHFLATKLNRDLPARIKNALKKVKHRKQETKEDEIPANTLKLVCLCVGEVLDIPSEQIKETDYLQVDLGADSLNLVEILSEVENSFPTFSAPQITEIRTITDLCMAAMGKFQSDSDLPQSNLDKDLTQIENIKINPYKSISELFVSTFSNNKQDSFTYDAMLGSTNRKDFFLKACVVAELLKNKVPEKHVGIMLPALQSTTLLIAACYLSDKIPVMLNWTVGNKVLEHCIETAGIKKILSAGSFIDKVKEMLPESIHSKIILLEKEVPNINLITKLKGAFKATFPAFTQTNQPDDTAVILFTSGSEALPKAVPLSHKNIVSDLSSVFDMIEVSNNEIFLSFLPPFHSFGFTVLSILPLITGVKIAYTPNPTDAREVLKILKHVQANVLIGTPGFLKLLLSQGTSYFFKSIHYAISGAEAMPLEVKEKFESMTKDGLILEGYGITECSPVISLNPVEKQKLNSVGKLLPGLSGLIIDIETGKKLATGETGMIYISGDNVFGGYLDQPELKPFKTIDGKQYYKTGDLGYIDDEGYLFITGRLKRFIKIAGEMISLPFIENILLEKYGEEDQQVLAVEGSDKVSPADIVLFTIKDIDLMEANNYLLKNGVAAIAKIKRIEKVDEIPLLGTGKINYRVLKEKIEK